MMILKSLCKGVVIAFRKVDSTLSSIMSLNFKMKRNKNKIGILNINL